MIQGKTFTIAGGIPKIPELANGAYVQKNSPQLAIIGDNKYEPEIIAPESKISEAVERGLNKVLDKINSTKSNNVDNDKPIELIVKIGNDTIGRAAVKSINSITRRNGGKCPIII